MDSYTNVKVFCLLLALQCLIGCAAGGSHRDTIDPPSLQSPALIRATVDVVTGDEELQIAVTGSQPFSYHLVQTETATGLVVDIPQAHFIDRPERIAVHKAGVKQLLLGRIAGSETGARLQIDLTQPAAYRITKEPERLVVHFPRKPAGLVTLGTAYLPEGLQAPAPASAEDYRVGPKDILDITVYREPDLSKRFRVTGEGMISFPLIGKVKIAGLTMAEVERNLEKRLAQGYLVKPQASVMVAEYQSQQVLVLGAVSHPGYYPLRGRTTLLDILSRAGGLKQVTRQNKYLVLMRQREAGQVHGHDATIRASRVDLDRLLDQGDTTLNKRLQSEDVIFVPQPASIVVFGEVKNPGAISLSERMTLVEAISKAGGFTSTAATGRVRIIRTANGGESTMRVNVADILKRGSHSENIALEPDDIVVVPTSLF
ncbi:MAG: polysaccharide biosynthesis/export family protein [Candidatus Tectomicrobia bacterium]|nr:polysaccharide biosynthesis/export family protein [Candidatus Tectomicrobia bacterium]